MVAQEIINKARTDIKKFIILELWQIMTAKKKRLIAGDDVVLDFAKEGIDTTYISVFIYDTYEDGDYHRFPITKLTITSDDWLYVEVGEIEGGEISWEEIKTDDLVAIANTLENYYNKLIKK